MRGWRASRANGALYMCAAKFVRTASEPFSRTFSGRRCAYRRGTSALSTAISSGVNNDGKNR